MMKLFTPFSDETEVIDITPELARRYSLDEWGRSFKLGTAGYRDLLDSTDMSSPDVPFNTLTMALVAAARRDVAIRHGLKRLHIGGEVRPHTQKFINLFARIYAAAGMQVHLRQDSPTTPIWLSSFGVFHYDLDGGENFTASHSPSFKGGWKPMDAFGMQLLDMSTEITQQVRHLVDQALTSGVSIDLAPSSSPLIKRDFEPYDAYVDMLRSILPRGLVESIRSAMAGGLRVAISTVGGSMGRAAREVFGRLDLPVDDGITLLHEKEDSNFYGIGTVDGVNHGPDPGKWQVYRHIGAKELLLERRAHVVFIWDPDGDRFNMVTQAPGDRKDDFTRSGLEVEDLDDTRVLVYFKPNQIYFLLTAMRFSSLSPEDVAGEATWLVGLTFPTSRSIYEVAVGTATALGIAARQVLVPVGFKYFGNLVRHAETTEEPYVNVIGREISLHPNPKFMIMAEESGGAAMGPLQPYYSVGGRKSLAIKEKDAMQVGVMLLGLAAELWHHGESFATRYMDLLERYDIRHRAYERRDVMLYDESLRGEERVRAKAAGEKQRDDTVRYFRSLTEKSPAEVTQNLRRATGMDDFPEVTDVFWAGDGTFIQFREGWFEIRASGTDAVLRYYMEGPSPGWVERWNQALVSVSPS